MGRVTQRDGASLVALGGCITECIDAADNVGGESAELAAALGGSWQRLVEVTMAMFGSGDVEAAMANSAVYLEAFGHIVIAWMWLEQFLAAGDQPGDFYDGKRQAARYFFRYELPRTAAQLRLLEPGPDDPGDAPRLVLSRHAVRAKIRASRMRPRGSAPKMG